MSMLEKKGGVNVHFVSLHQNADTPFDTPQPKPPSPHPQPPSPVSVTRQYRRLERVQPATGGNVGRRISRVRDGIYCLPKPNKIFVNGCVELGNWWCVPEPKQIWRGGCCLLRLGPLSNPNAVRLDRK